MRALKFRRLIVMSVLSAALSSCAYSITEIDTEDLEPSCVRTCTTTYSACVSGGNQIGFKTETLRACRESYQACVKTCPRKK